MARRMGGSQKGIYGGINLGDRGSGLYVRGFGLDGRGGVGDLDLIKYNGELKKGDPIDPTKIEWHVELEASGTIKPRKLQSMTNLVGKPPKVLKLPVRYEFCRSFYRAMGKVASATGKIAKGGLGALAIFGGVATVSEFADAAEGPAMRGYVAAVRVGKLDVNKALAAGTEFAKAIGGPNAGGNAAGLTEVLVEVGNHFSQIRTEIITQLRVEWKTASPERRAEILGELGSFGDRGFGLR